MTEVVEPSQDRLFTTGGGDSIPPLDPEADAVDALRTLRQFVLDDLPDDAPPVENWHGLDAYIEELCGYGIEKLTREPEDLNSASLRLKNELEDVSCGNYRALIESFECAGAVRDGVADVRSRLDELVLALPKLADAMRQFAVDVAEKQRERERRLRSITEHHAIRDILEMPRLMKTLIAAEMYDEALELRENAIKLGTMHIDETLICNVCNEMDILTQQMVLKLLVLLRNSIQLPICLRVVGFLRRLRLFSEFRLRMLFLHCRGEWMRSGIESSTASSQQAQLVSLSDNTRAMVFEIITQYRAVFNDDMDNYDDQGEPDDDAYEANTGRNARSSAILFDWTSSCVSDFLERLKTGVKDISDGAALNTVLQQAMYCGQSLGRVGADFRAALPPIFEAAVLRICNSHLNAALRQFEMMIEDNRWAPVGSSALRKERGHSFSEQEKNLASSAKQPIESEEGIEDSSNDQYDPPVGVLESPPLAVFLNGILAAFNELRSCAPVSLGPQLGKKLQDVLIRAGEYMNAMGGPGGAFLKRSDRPHFVAMSSSLRDLCVQHAARCLDYCMNRNGLVNVSYVQEKLLDVFGETLVPVSLSSETEARLNSMNGSVLELGGGGNDVGLQETQSFDRAENSQFESLSISETKQFMPPKITDEEADESVLSSAIEVSQAEEGGLEMERKGVEGSSSMEALSNGDGDNVIL